MNTQVITIDTITIKQDSEGRYCLNDLHKAAGEALKHKPFNFTARDEFRELRAEIEKAGIPAIRTTAGRNGGTYVCKELVYAYAMWISASFNALHKASPPEGHPCI